MSEIMATQSEDGRSLQVQSGDTVLIRLRESPTTGYRWTMAEGNETILAFRDSDFVRDAGAGVGGGGLRTFRFQALGSGIVEVQLKLWREWEGDRSTKERYRLTVQVS